MNETAVAGRTEQISARPMNALFASALMLAACGGPPNLYGVTPPGDLGTGSMPNNENLSCGPDTTVGVPVADRPVYEERAALYDCNRARTDPSNTDPSGAMWGGMFPPVPPLAWNDDLAQSARAHSMDMRDTPCFQHNSCDGTDVFVRIKSYFTGSMTLGENIAAGVSDGQTAIYNWINEIGAPPGETGHRENMFSANYALVGFGFAAGGSGQLQGYWTQDFGGGPTPPHLAVGSYSPSTVSVDQQVTFGTVYYDKGGAAPDSVQVILDGTAIPLTLANGKAALGAYEGQYTLTAGCHRFRFRAVVGGTPSCYPGKGTLGVGAFNTTCADYDAN